MELTGSYVRQRSEKKKVKACSKIFRLLRDLLHCIWTIISSKPHLNTQEVELTGRQFGKPGTGPSVTVFRWK